MKKVLLAIGFSVIWFAVFFGTALLKARHSPNYKLAALIALPFAVGFGISSALKYASK
ncbi:hypothetical protein NXH67_04150 [Butyrivibrio sp. DSM 10294]|uniref:hypothetical protein n=1 Tax=Butyrivibrio sp. DSM 10294 TaxID=2972457 RepID=UPI00234E8180|nr:hypothetical protein [Butyrivibrio sp. DSM 10294]MDC7292705.1 hypothetical protein [Butyrivibrio sp. DSM 10294]